MGRTLPWEVREQADDGMLAYSHTTPSVCVCASLGAGDRSGRKCLTCRTPHYEMRTRSIFRGRLTGEIQERLKQNSKGRGGRTGEVGREIRSQSAQAHLRREHVITIPRGV